jgi:hypothetical protein
MSAIHKAVIDPTKLLEVSTILDYYLIWSTTDEHSNSEIHTNYTHMYGCGYWGFVVNCLYNYAIGTTYSSRGVTQEPPPGDNEDEEHIVVAPPDDEEDDADEEDHDDYWEPEEPNA